ncbi:MAG: iron uptake porin [Pseudanabaena sp. RU_4_16]|nr:iron uptake porin [Pseudanabaena sp. RU_4_16]
MHNLKLFFAIPATALTVFLATAAIAIASELDTELTINDSISKVTAAETPTAPTATKAAIASTVDDNKESSLTETLDRDRLGQNPDLNAQNVTSVSQLSDVKPTDWAFTALQSLVERYGCIAGYPDRTYRGQRAMTRYEFAAGLNACLDKINEIITAGLADKVSKEDLAVVQKLQEEFAAELAALRGRVEALEAKSAQIEAQQFSTTTKLNGLAFFNITGSSANRAVRREIGRRDPVTGAPLLELRNNPNVTFSNLVWLNLLTSFTGKDLLVTQLVAGNGDSPNSENGFASAGLLNTWGTPFTEQTPAGAGANKVALQEFSYQFPIFNDKTQLKIGPAIVWYRVFDQNRFTLFLNGSGTFNSINSTLSSPVKQGAGAVVSTALSDQIELMVGYLAENNTFLPGTRSAGNPNEGLFGGTNILTGQVTFSPSRDFNLRLLYSHVNQQPNPFNGQVGGLAPINGQADDGFGGALNNAQSDIYIANFDWLVSKGFGLFGRYSFSNTNLNPSNGLRSRGSISAQAFQIGLAFPDLFKEGAQGTISFGMPFNYTSGRNFLVSGGGDGGIQYDLEATYFLPISRNIAIVPNLYVIFNPNNFSSNPTVFAANMRMQFNF